jgi:hypothetical protein
MIEDSKLQERYAREEQKMGNENDEPNSAEVDYDGHVMRTPDEWCRIKQIQILDADGWRGVQAKAWNAPLTELDFEERAMVCTQRSVATQPAGEHHTGSLDLTGEGNAPEHDGETCPHPEGPCTHDVVMPGVTGATLTLAAEAFAGLPRPAGDYTVAQTILEASLPAIRQQVAEEIARGIEAQVGDGEWAGDYYRKAAQAARAIGAGTATAPDADVRARIIADLTTRRAEITEGRPGWVYLTEAIGIAKRGLL